MEDLVENIAENLVKNGSGTSLGNAQPFFKSQFLKYACHLDLDLPHFCNRIKVY